MKYRQNNNGIYGRYNSPHPNPLPEGEGTAVNPYSKGAGTCCNPLSKRLLTPVSLLLTPFSLLLTTLFFLAGCVTALKPPHVDMSALKPPGPATTVAAAWEPAVSNGENPMRGFGGRIYLYDQDMQRPIKAKGTIVVYIFDEEGRMPGDEKPNEGLVFNEKILNSKGVYKKSKVGHSYNLWIPIDAAGPEGQAKKISLIVRYIPEKGGSSVTSTQTTAHLPGRHNDETMAAHARSNGQMYRDSDPIYQVSAQRLSSNRPPPERARLTEERMIESADRPQILQAVTIR